MTESADRDWYLKDWAAFKGKRQADLVQHLDWPKGRVSKIWNGRQPYKRDLVNLLAAWLEIKPYELLMPPAEAMALRRLRETAAQIVGDSAPPADEAAPAAPRPNTSSR